MKTVLALVLGILLSTPVFAAKAKDLTGAPLELGDLAKLVSQETGRAFVLDPAVRGKVTLISSDLLKKEMIYRTFLTSLAINGFTVVDENGYQRVMNSRLAQKTDLPMVTAAPTTDEERMMIMTVHLPKTVSAQEVNKSFRGMTSKDGDMQVFESTNTVMVSDYTSSLKRIAKLLESLESRAGKN